MIDYQPREQPISVHVLVTNPSSHWQELQTSNGDWTWVPLHWSKLGEVICSWTIKLIIFYVINIYEYANSFFLCWYRNLLGTRGPIGLDPGGQDFRQPRTPLQSAPTLPTTQCWVPGLHLGKEHAWMYKLSKHKIVKTNINFIIWYLWN